MLPHQRCPPPRGFNAAVGVRSASFLPRKPQFIRRRASRGRFAVGMRYEREAKDWLSLFALGRAEISYRDGPWIEFRDRSGRRWCQPDALLENKAAKYCLICEIKYQHTSDAWWQLRELYLPVLRCALPGYSFRLLEIVHWYDPLTIWPEEIALVPDIGRCLGGESEEVATLIFNKRRERRIREAGYSGSAGAGEEARQIWPAEGAE